MTSTSPTSEAIAAANKLSRGAMTGLARGAIERVLISLIADEIGRARKRSVDPADWSRWTRSTTIDEDGVGVDSLGRLDLVARVNEFFHMHEVGSEDYLVVRRTIGDWVEIVEATLERQFERLTFQTSGSTGTPKRVAHRVDQLVAEIDAFAELLGPVQRIVACAPPHHLYGFLFTALWPSRYVTEVWDARTASPSLLNRVGPGDLVVATPYHWNMMLPRAADATLDQSIGLTSSAPTPPECWRAAREAGLGRLVEIYGSTETAGVGWRDDVDAPFKLVKTWRRAADDGALERATTPGHVVAAPDRLDWRSADAFAPKGRADGAVQIGGVNVFPDRVAKVLAEASFVRACAVRPDGQNAGARLKAFVVLAEPLEEGLAVERLQDYCRETLSAVERPVSFRFGDATPRNAMGKLVDWDA